MVRIVKNNSFYKKNKNKTINCDTVLNLNLEHGSFKKNLFKGDRAAVEMEKFWK